MRKTILVVHGMRKGKLNETLLNFIHQTFNSDEIDYEVAFLESEEILLDEVIQQTVDAGYSRIHLVPLLLFTASHYYEDIEALYESFKENNPKVQFILSKPLGTHPIMTNWVASQLEAYKDDIDDESGIVVLAHGNARFDEPDVALTRICHELSTDQNPCYPSMVYGELRFKETLPKIAKKHRKLLIIPFFFYDGFLVNKSKRQIESLGLPNPITYTTAINFHPLLKDIVHLRIAECEAVPDVSSTT
ncbi:sirohydrochlorin chelatase [Mammaliicoccus sciuri]|uniref:sirohydrochlorin chelatase n=1 Tax=Mammaliicoccus sciuri TaxID=1296 RepID=UPI000733CB46|nr:sirohydrochlorin chelatase [Mammaliicoccus sciuri]KTT83123.1 sirohydrochlorin ferrochelatase [Mammaliicoccus sciuri]MBA1397489.1 sirohydrochlorin chelatase [Mammaliicoccus sciuri]MBF0719869.1 sirohydrochlorin chelatase [Mammaliicoccus sciuri]MBU6089847.1 sirohydrochlorin chelatase [Mammaliicoccus sciuri]MBW3107957.1 sirohydrochlorin chelatase [Mammaliicoccus sciuri]